MAGKAADAHIRCITRLLRARNPRPQVTTEMLILALLSRPAAHRSISHFGVNDHVE